MILLTGTTGNVGSEVARLLDEASIGYRAAPRPDLDFERPDVRRGARGGGPRLPRAAAGAPTWIDRAGRSSRRSLAPR